MKKAVFVVVFLCLSLTACALAAGPAGGVRGVALPQAASRSYSMYLSGPDFLYTGAEGKWTLTYAGATGSTTYIYTVGKDDHSFLDEDIVDTQYVEKSRSRTFAWTCYDPGSYVLFAQACDANGNVVDVTYAEFEVEYHPDGDALRTRVAEVAAECAASSDYLTALNIYDWLIGHVEYDDTYTYFTADAAILNGRCVCNGYAKAFVLLARACGLEAGRVTGVIRDEVGNPNEEGGHAWNVVKVDGQWYKLDATWDDGVGHIYFLVDDDLMEVQHCKRVTDIGNVVCDSMAANYYITEGLAEDIAAPVIDGVNDRLSRGAHLYGHWVAEIIEGDDYDTDVMYARHLVGKIAAHVLEYYPFTWKDGTELVPPDYWRTVDYAMDGDDQYYVTVEFHTSRVFTLPEGITEVDEETFAGTGAHVVVIPEGCTDIGDYAFRGVPLWDIYIPESIETIADHALDETSSGCFFIWSDSYDVWVYAAEHGFDLGEE